jgi:hypothetical protein
LNEPADISETEVNIMQFILFNYPKLLNCKRKITKKKKETQYVGSLLFTFDLQKRQACLTFLPDAGQLGLKVKKCRVMTVDVVKSLNLLF